jgi:hypothetical protein
MENKFVKKFVRILIIVIILNCSLFTLQKADGEMSEEKFCLNAESIAKSKTQEDFKKLISMYRQNSSRKQLECLAESLLKISPDDTRDFFVKTLQDKDKDVSARAAFGLGVIKDKKAVEPLHRAYQDPDSGIKCNVAYALGNIKDSSSLPLLIPDLDSKYPATRRCIIKALKAYNDPKNCQKFYDMWMKDTDENVQFEAGIAVIDGSCEDRISRSTESNIAPKYCLVAQSFINKTAEAIMKQQSNKEWTKNIDFGINPNEIDYNKSDKDTQMKMSLMMAIGDWGDSVDKFYGKKDRGSLKENQSYYFLEIIEYRRKEEALKHLCPKLNFPDFEYWNKLILMCPK